MRGSKFGVQGTIENDNIDFFVGSQTTIDIIGSVQRFGDRRQVRHQGLDLMLLFIRGKLSPLELVSMGTLLLGPCTPHHVSKQLV
jgi:hypothetical protein